MCEEGTGDRERGTQGGSFSGSGFVNSFPLPGSPDIPLVVLSVDVPIDC